MSLRTILWLVGVVLGVMGVAQLPCIAVALWHGEAWLPIAVSSAAALGIALCLLAWPRREELSLDHRSAFLAVTLAWISACAAGALPYMEHPALRLSFVDAFFESTSGLTTTGATVLRGLDVMPRSILLWRGTEQWVGGMGMVLLGVAVFPILGLGGMQLFRAETPGPTKDKITPRIAETAKLLWTLYVGVTVADAGLLYLGGMGPLEAICHAFSTVSTGGFSTSDSSLAHYDSSFLNAVTSVFMLVGGGSFAVLHTGLTRGIHWRDHPELRAYLGIFAIASLLIAIDLRLGMPDDFPSAADALEHAIFQAASILTTTGFTTRDFDLWPPISHAVLLSLCFVGGMAGSTGGGVKVIRVVVTVKVVLAQLFRLVHPRGLGAVKIADRTLPDHVVQGVLAFTWLWVTSILVGTALLALFGADVFTAFSAAAVTLGNIGPGFEGVGPSNVYAGFAGGAKLVMSGLMILGRLEILTALVLLTPGFWRG